MLGPTLWEVVDDVWEVVGVFWVVADGPRIPEKATAETRSITATTTRAIMIPFARFLLFSILDSHRNV